MDWPLCRVPSCPRGDAVSLPLEHLQAFLDCDAELKLDRSMDSTTSGSTAVFALIHNRQLTVAHVGDSRCLVGGLDRYGTVVSRCLTVDHNPGDMGERERVQKSGGLIQPLIGESGNFEGPERIWLPDRPVQGITMTRSFGDNMFRAIGATAEPEVSILDLHPDDRYLVLCSDGESGMSAPYGRPRDVC